MTSEFIGLFVESRNYTAALTEIEHLLSPSSSMSIVNRATAKTEAGNSAKNSFFFFFMGIRNVLSEEKTHEQDSVGLAATLILLKWKR